MMRGPATAQIRASAIGPFPDCRTDRVRHRPILGEALRRTASCRSCGMQRFVRDERGAVTLEFTILVPFFMMFLVLFADATVIYLTHTVMFNAAREISRRASTGEIQNLSQAASYAGDKLLLGARAYYVNVDFSGDEKTVRIGIPLYDAAIFGVFFRPILGRELVSIATVSEEPRI